MKRSWLHTWKFWLVLSYFLGTLVFIQLWTVNKNSIQRTCEAQNETRVLLVQVFDTFRIEALNDAPTRAQRKRINLVFDKALASLQPSDCK